MKTLKLSIFIVISVISINIYGQVGYSSASFSQTRSNGILFSDQIVIEEFMNYHKHRIPMPAEGEEIALDVRWGNKFVNSNTNEAVLQIGIATGAFDDYSEAPPLNICLVIDKSGSMSNDHRMDKLKIALNEFIESLRPDDILSIVTYDTDAGIIFPAQKVGNAKLVKLVISSLSTGGSTNLNAGMVMGYEEVLKNLQKSRTNKVILLTDGLANAGTTNSEKIVENSAVYNKKGISISTIGVGNGVNYNLLRQISKNGNGANHFIGSAEDVQKVFIDEVESLLSPIAKDVTLEVDFGDNLDLEHIFGYSPKISRTKVSFSLDDINSSLTQIVLLKFNTGKINNKALGKVNVTFKYFDIKADKNKVISKKIALGFEKNNQKSFLLNKEVKRNYIIAIMAQALKDMASKSEAGKKREAQLLIDNCLQEVYSYYPKPKDKSITRVLDIVKKYSSTTGNKKGL